NLKKVLTTFCRFTITTPHTEQHNTNMRTKTLLLTAAIGVAGVASSFAQAVYSVNAVGYVNVSVAKNPSSATTFLLVANPLNSGGNTIGEVLPNVPDFTILFTFNNTSGQFEGAFTYLGGWDV